VEGRWRNGTGAKRGQITGPVGSHYESGSLVAWAATLRAAAPYQAERRNAGGKQLIAIRAPDVRIWRRRPPTGCLLLFLIDASGSMAAWKRMRQTKSAILALLLQAYQRRDRIAFLVFRGLGAELTLPPTRGLRTARQVLEELAVGGTTPLAHGLAAAAHLIHQQRRRQPRQPIWTVLLTDGRANVVAAMGDPWNDALAQARVLRASPAEFLVVDTETGWLRFGKAAELARALGARCLSVEEVLGPPLNDPFPLPAVS
jgi:magnesium chelatase subunit D